MNKTSDVIKENHAYLVLHIKSSLLTIEDISSQLNIIPTQSIRKGELIPRTVRCSDATIWTFNTKEIDGYDIDLHWQTLNEKLPQVKEVKSIQEKSMVSLFIRGQFYTMSPLIEVSNKSLNEIAEYGFGLGYDILDLNE